MAKWKRGIIRMVIPTKNNILCFIDGEKQGVAAFIRKEKLPPEYRENPQDLIDLPCVYRYFKNEKGEYAAAKITLVRIKIDFGNSGRLEVGDY